MSVSHFVLSSSRRNCWLFFCFLVCVRRHSAIRSGGESAKQKHVTKRVRYSTRHSPAAECELSILPQQPNKKEKKNEGKRNIYTILYRKLFVIIYVRLMLSLPVCFFSFFLRGGFAVVNSRPTWFRSNSAKSVSVECYRLGIWRHRSGSSCQNIAMRIANRSLTSRPPLPQGPGERGNNKV